MGAEPVGKAQLVRVLDVILIGPVMIRAAWELRESSPIISAILGVSGAATILYNWTNYVREDRRHAAQLRHTGSHVSSEALSSVLRSSANPGDQRDREVVAAGES